MTEYENHSSEHRTVYTEADFDGSRPAPLRLIGDNADPATVERQDKLALSMRGATKQELTGIISDKAVDFVSNGIISRMHMREALNSFSYNNRLYKYPHPWLVPGHSWKEVYDACHETVRGARSMVQSDMAHRALGMPSIEHRNLTMIGEFRRELETPMWEEVSDFLGVDARPHANQDYRVKLHGFSDDLLKSKEVEVMRIELKRVIDDGVLDNGTVPKVRTTASINTSFNSDFDQNVIRSLREQHFEALRDNKKSDLSQNPEFLACVGFLIDNALPAGFVLARNETVFGSNKEMADKVWQRDIRRRRRKAFAQGRRHIQ